MAPQPPQGAAPRPAPALPEAFAALNLKEQLLRALATEGYTTPTPIQQQAIPHVLAGKDVLGVAQTGTGKTAAFALPILQRLRDMGQPAAGKRPIRALILSPTRELASQINDSFRAYGRYTGLTSAVIFGGVSQNPQVDTLRKSLDVLIATPGRLLDLYGQGFVDLRNVNMFVLDEADRMLDMGFIHDVKRLISALPRDRQNLLFSATMPPAIAELANGMLKQPVRVEVTPVSSTAEKIAQSVYYVEGPEKRSLLLHLLKDGTIARTLVFTRTKHGANRLAEQLMKAGVGAEAIHGNKSQGARERAMNGFRSGKVRVLVATDLAARGIDVDGITHVINYDMPNEPETYVHRIGRTARAGKEGAAMSFCALDERPFLRDIQRVTRQNIPVVENHPHVSRFAPPIQQAVTAKPAGSPAANIGRPRRFVRR
jgi:ATP-dependent RNA helicase RhlE